MPATTRCYGNKVKVEHFGRLVLRCATHQFEQIASAGHVQDFVDPVGRLAAFLRRRMRRFVQRHLLLLLRLLRSLLLEPFRRRLVGLLVSRCRLPTFTLAVRRRHGRQRRNVGQSVIFFGRRMDHGAEERRRYHDQRLVLFVLLALPVGFTATGRHGESRARSRTPATSPLQRSVSVGAGGGRQVGTFPLALAFSRLDGRRNGRRRHLSGQNVVDAASFAAGLGQFGAETRDVPHSVAMRLLTQTGTFDHTGRGHVGDGTARAVRLTGSLQFAVSVPLSVRQQRGDAGVRLHRRKRLLPPLNSSAALMDDGVALIQRSGSRDGCT